MDVDSLTESLEDISFAMATANAAAADDSFGTESCASLAEWETSPSASFVSSRSSVVPETRPWWKGAVFYQIWPRSFKDSNGDGRGDIQGIISKLDYLKSLGIDAIWVSPMYKSPMDDWGYDISDYESVHEDFGTLRDLESLIAEVHNRDMKILMDLVITHVSDQHPWFVESRSSRDNDKADWFHWADKRPGHVIKGDLIEEPSNWRACFGGSAWKWSPEREQYYLHLFLESQPDLNWHNPAMREAVYQSAVKFWIDRGVDGFRLDTANRFGKQPGYPDVISDDPVAGPWQPGRHHYVDLPIMHTWLKELRARMDSYAPGKELMLLGELPHTPYENVLKYVRPCERELSVSFDFDVVKLGNNDNPDEVAKHEVAYYTDGDASFTLPLFKDYLTKVQKMITETDAWGTVFMENHDQCRSIARYTTPEPRYWNRAAKLLALMQTTLSGTEFIYQGQEIGMTNMPDTWKKEDLRDPDSVVYVDDYTRLHPEDPEAEQNAYKGIFRVGRDNSRTPMQWTADAHAGFTTGEPWMRVNENYSHINVAAQLDSPHSIWRFWQARIAMRKRFRDTFMYGKFLLYDRDNEQTFTYAKLADDGQLAEVVLNFSDTAVPLTKWQKDLVSPGMEFLVSNVSGDEKNPGFDPLQPWEGRVYIS